MANALLTPAVAMAPPAVPLVAVTLVVDTGTGAVREYREPVVGVLAVVDADGWPTLDYVVAGEEGPYRFGDDPHCRQSVNTETGVYPADSPPVSALDRACAVRRILTKMRRAGIAPACTTAAAEGVARG